MENIYYYAIPIFITAQFPKTYLVSAEHISRLTSDSSMTDTRKHANYLIGAAYQRLADSMMCIQNNLNLNAAGVELKLHIVSPTSDSVLFV